MILYTEMTDIALANVLDKRFALRKLLVTTSLHETTTAIDKKLLTPELEPFIRDQLKTLALQLVACPEKILCDTYSETERKKDWLALLQKNVLDSETGAIIAIDARTRPGHKILDHHMPHFYAVTNYKGKSVQGLFTVPVLEKALWTNLLMHSTPYKSEIRRMITMTAGLGSVTKYRTVTSKALIQFFGAKRVLDPCTGWGGRMLGCLAAGADTSYVGCEPDPNTAKGLRDILADPALPTAVSARARIIAKPAELALAEDIGTMEKFDMLLTSPPYFNLEMYTAGEQSSLKYPTWEFWTEQWLKPVILASLACLKADGVSCWSVKNFKTDKAYPLADVTKKIHAEAGWHLVKTVAMTGSARPGAKGKEKVPATQGPATQGPATQAPATQAPAKKKSEEETFCFRLSSKPVFV